MFIALNKQDSAEIIVFPKQKKQGSDRLLLQPDMALPEMDTDHYTICESCKL